MSRRDPSAGHSPLSAASADGALDRQLGEVLLEADPLPVYRLALVLVHRETSKLATLGTPGGVLEAPLDSLLAHYRATPGTGEAELGDKRSDVCSADDASPQTNIAPDELYLNAQPRRIVPALGQRCPRRSARRVLRVTGSTARP
eukprot:CAMPEP_0170571966 /NCGR_PEP_ID=MMETSP0224-20130122/1962_1 /TAXON_ID=285029 /ORGANISM="Togula jolla, Strain CCCM 725" /LENGTH=144 /DNA_ID=CAMNT_0010894419 /DNA_START=85 /DNA_END=516 /DNA_ORIENTATION=+